MSKKSKLKQLKIVSKLGQGSFGLVYKVRRPKDPKFYVMKVIDTCILDQGTQQEANKEVQILGSLEHPYIVKYYDSFIEKENLHIIMQYCEKGDLSALIKSQNGRLLPEPRIWRYFIQLCLGVEYLHGRKILHRDIKTLNVFLDKNDKLRIGDLGVAKILNNTYSFANTTVGSPYYLSPEICEEKPYNTKSDIWALGCVLYELCTLQHPFQANNQGALVLRILRANYSPISTVYSLELRQLVEMILQKDHQSRPSISQILEFPEIKKKVLELKICVPEGSILRPPRKKLEEETKAIPNLKVNLSAPVLKPSKPPLQIQVKLSQFSSSPKALSKRPTISSQKGSPPQRQIRRSQTSKQIRRKEILKRQITKEPSNTYYVLYKPTIPLFQLSKGFQRSQTMTQRRNSEIEKSKEDGYISHRDLLMLKKRKIFKRESDLQILADFRKQEMIEEVGEAVFQEMYQFFSLKVTCKQEMGSTEQEQIDLFILEKIPNNQYNIIYSMYKLLHLQGEIKKCLESLEELEYELLFNP